MWKYIKGQNLNGAHNSLVDVKVQTDILINKMLVGFINRTTSIQTVDAIFSSTQKNDWRKEMEPEQPVHSTWVEQTKENNFEWTPPEDDSYTDFARGPLLGPTTYIQGTAMQTHNLASIFLAILPLAFFSKVAEFTNNYSFEDWVVEKTALDSDGNQRGDFIWKLYPHQPMENQLPGTTTVQISSESSGVLLLDLLYAGKLSSYSKALILDLTRNC